MARAGERRKKSDVAQRGDTVPRADARAAAAGATPSKGLDRSLTLLEILGGVDGLSLTDVALTAGVPASTAHRILMTLEAHKFVTQDEERGLWFIGVRAFEIGNAFLRHRKLVDMGRAIMHELMEHSGESVNLAIEDADEAVYVAQVESHQSVRAFHRAGSRGPMHALAVGKAWLAAMDDDAVRALLQRTGLDAFSPNTLTAPAPFFEDLERTRARGWAENNEEHEAGMCAVATPVFDEHGRVVASLSITGPATRMSAERRGELGPMVKRAAAEITRSIGGRAPPAFDA
ncbi:MAG: IclR family transcriptional regulator [Pseudomonadota bacterium]